MNNIANIIEKFFFYCFIIIISPFFFLRFVFKILKQSRYGAIVVIQIYMFCSVLFFFYGPINYPVVNVVETTVLLILYNLFFIGGYFLADNKFVVNGSKFNIKYSTIRLLFILGVIASLFFYSGYFINYSNTLNISIIIKDIISGILNPREAYLKNLNIEIESGILTQLWTLFSPLVYLTIPLGLYYFRKLNFFEKFLLVFVIILDLSTYINKGTNFGIFKIAVIFFVIFYFNKNIKKINNITKMLISFALFYFLYSISSRMNLISIPYSVFGIEVNNEHLLFNIFPLFLSVPLMLGISYISQGYYGLSLATLYDYEPTYGFGSGRFLISNVESMFNVNVWERTYQYKMDGIWDSGVNWHTIYVWFANDVGLYGVPIIMAVIGFMFCLVIKDVKENKSLIATILLPLYIIMILFIPANNIIFDNPLMFLPFIFFNIVWIFSKKWRVKL